MGITKCRKLLDDFADSSSQKFSVMRLFETQELQKEFLNEVANLSNVDLRTIYDEQMTLNKGILTRFSESYKKMPENKLVEQLARFKAYVFILESLQNQLYDYKYSGPIVLKFAQQDDLLEMYKQY
ncbi:MAG: hypothetical protein ACI4PF_01030, partial [Christensenellales bacterium]